MIAALLQPGARILHRSGRIDVVSHRQKYEGGEYPVWILSSGQPRSFREIDEDYVHLSPAIGAALWHLLYLGAVTMPRELPEREEM